MKRLIAALGILAILNGVPAQGPRIEQKQKEFERDGVALSENVRTILFDNGSITYQTRVRKGEKKLHKGKWGDYLFGLTFGRPKAFNGSWSTWNFLEVNFRKNNRNCNALSEFLPENVSMMKMPDRTIVDFTFLLDEAGADDKVYLRAMQFKSHREWMFFRVKFDSRKYKPWRLKLNAYPGNARNPKERERWAATVENQYNLSGGAASFVPLSPGLIFFNKYVYEEYGNMIVFNPGDFEQVSLPKGGVGVSAQFFPKPGISEYVFGLSYFMDKSVGDILPRFLEEGADGIAAFIRSIDWDPDLNSDEFGQIVDKVKEIIRIMKNSGADTTVFEKELAEIHCEYETARQKRDLHVVFTAQEKLNLLRANLLKSGLNAFR